MAKERSSINLFLDTQVFSATHYNLASKDFLRLRSLVQEGYAQIFLTSVTQREIISHIHEHAIAAFNSINAARRSLAILSPLPAPFDALASVTKDSVQKAFGEKFEEFCKILMIEIISIDDIAPEDIMDAYFKRRPPFGEGKKKSEFPDAFAAAALEAWCKARRQKIVVVSGDGDWRNRCNISAHLDYKERLVDALTLFPDAAVAAKIIQSLKDEPDELIQMVKRGFPEMGFYLFDNEGDAEDIEVNDVTPQEFFVVEARDGGAVVEIDCLVTFSAQVTFDDPDSWMYDSEDKSVMYMNTISGKVDTDTEITVEVELKYDESEPAVIAVKRVVLPMGDDVGIRCDNVEKAD